MTTYLLGCAVVTGCAGSHEGKSGTVRFDGSIEDAQLIDGKLVFPEASVPNDATVDSSVSEDASADSSTCGVCAPGQSQAEACACGTGQRTRSCSSDCNWLAWSACAGGAAFPRLPGNMDQEVCPPYERPAVFFSPHPDDESIGMAGAIVNHIEAGRTVFIELMTHGDASGVRTRLADTNTDAWHAGAHNYTLTATEFGNARVREFLEAAEKLGVDGVFVSDFGDGNLTTAEVASRISFWTARQDTGLSLKGTVGSQDPRSEGGTWHADHQAVWDALGASGHGDVRGYLIYHHGVGAGTFSSSVMLSANQCSTKQNAIASYKVWSPNAGRYAIGYHSTPDLFDNAGKTCLEYVVVP